ncbi:hypothetical protein [Actinoplanes sp. NPDC026623]|uniref:hypothetical protein n=1 Tax=Actinoplanes sp. NPDC026623 TaxID=3155610 RepID=UPI0033CD28B4
MVIAATVTGLGVALLLLAAFWLNDGDADADSVLGIYLQWLAATAAVLGAVAAVYRRQVGLETGELRARRRVWIWTGLAGLVAAGATAAGLANTIHRYAGGFVDTAGPLTALGGLAAFGGLVVLLFTRPEPGRVWRWRPAAITAMVTAVVLVAVAAALAGTADRWSVRATTTDSVAAVAAVPASVTAVAWSAAVPGTVEEVVAAGAGAVVRVSDGVLALDGRDGKARWSYRRHHAEAKWMAASPDGRTVVVSFVSLYGDSRTDRLVVLDAMSGRVRATFADDEMFWLRGHALVSNAMIVGQSVRHHTMGAWSASTGSRVWSWQPPAGCDYYEPKSLTAGADTVLIAVACGDEHVRGAGRELRFLTLDAASGRQLRESRLPTADLADMDVRFTAAPDGSLVLIHAAAEGERSQLLDVATGRLSPAPTGLYTLPGHGLAYPWNSSGPPALVDARSGETRQAAGKVAGCGRSGIVLAGGVVCVHDPTHTWFDAFVTTGLVPVHSSPVPGTTLTAVPVVLAAREEDEIGSFPVRFTAAPGAVIVYSTYAPASSENRVVGLR